MKKILIYGGSSFISIELLKLLYVKTDKFIIFCRNKESFKNQVLKLNFNLEKFEINQVDLENLQENFKLIEKANNIHGIFWVSGSTGDAKIEMLSSEECKKNININFFHPVLIINKLIKKLNKKNFTPFIVGITSVAGLRGRAKNMFYGSAKSAFISYLSGLRQKYNGEINIITVIPGYISTKNFNLSASSFLVTSPKDLARKIINAVEKEKEIIYSNFFWKFIMLLIKLIPEKIFKKLKF